MSRGMFDSLVIAASVCLMTNSDAPNEGLTQAEQASTTGTEQETSQDVVIEVPALKVKLLSELDDAPLSHRVEYINPPDEIAPERARRVPGPMVNTANSVADQQRQSSNLRDDDEA